MEQIYQSATKVVFIIMALALVGLTAARIVEPKDFIVLASMAFAFYFTKSGVNTGAAASVTTASVPVTEDTPRDMLASDNFGKRTDIDIKEL